MSEPTEASEPSETGGAAATAARGAQLLGGEDFSFAAAIGGPRGFVESILPGLVFVVAYITVGGFQVPVIASVVVVVAMVAARLIQRTPVTQALSGVLGVALGAVWAWRSGDAGEYFLPGLWINAAYLAAVLITMIVGWPVVGIAVGLLRGLGTSWRKDRALRRRMQLATAVLAATFLLRLVVQVPLYMSDNVAALGTAKLAMGVPLFALSLWVMWLLVGSVGRPQAARDQPQQT
ncbi:DUF3159 domain-containing protein [Demequina aurantiaca]|uniref:DUF3159 domain-containing protein n=1 Tax=Demequina aurantiaca TaxID=676200 RepID=UPI000780A0DF|nr:DUF3159 domain-containing protein [Demequina aurantiaca]